MLLGVGCVSASTLVVSKTSPACTSGDEYYTSIQAAVDSADDGDKIVVCPGTYVENIIVDKNLTIRSMNGPDSTIVQAKKPDKDAFEVTADYVEISGFTVNGAKRWLASGIHLHYADYCNISNNNCSNNNYGIYADYSSNNIIIDNICSNNAKGILLLYSNNNRISNNICTNNRTDIFLRDSKNNKLNGNEFENGIYMDGFIDGDSLSDYTHEIDTSNTVNGKPVYYWKDMSGGRVPDGAGQIILVNCTNVVVENQKLCNAQNGIQIAFSSYIAIYNNTCSNNENSGIVLVNSSSTIIEENVDFDSGIGIYLKSSFDNSIKNNDMISLFGVMLDSSCNNSLKNNNISSRNKGIHLDSYSSNNIIKNNVVKSNYYEGIWLESSSGYNTIEENIVSNNRDGINLYECDNNIIKNNTVNTNDYNGIVLRNSNYNFISKNIANSNGEVGIRLFSNSIHNTVVGNTANSNGDYGIELDKSNYNNISDNTANLNKKGICILGDINFRLVDERSHNNHIKGNIALDNRIGIFLASSFNNTIKNNIVSNNNDGISLYDSSNYTIKSNIALNNQIGIFIDYSGNNNIENNIVSNNLGTEQSGIYLSKSLENTLKNNIVKSNNGTGITLFNTWYTLFENNNIESNKFLGIYLYSYSSNNELYHNNIIENNIQATNDSLINYWHHPDLLEGNYWSDYNGTDINGDGIGDTDIPHPNIDYDNYPYTNKSGWLTFLVSPEYWDFGTVYQGEIVQQTFTLQNAFVHNKGEDDLTILSINLDNDISISDMNLPLKIPKGYSKTFNVTIDTTNLEGHILRSLEIQSDDKITPNKTILIYGFVKPPIHDVRIKNIDFQSRVIKGQISLVNITIENRGDFREKNVSIEFREGNKSLGNATITNIKSKETKSAIFKWDTTDVAPKTYDVLIEVKLKHQRLVDSLHVSVKINMPSAAQTLILTNKEKLVKYWGAERAEKLENELIKLSYHVGVAGIPVNVEEDEAVTSAYESWDLNLQNPQEANKVSKHIKKRIDEKLKEYTGIKYIIIVGDDRIIPYYRIHDNTDKPFRPELWQTGDDYHKVNIDSTVGSALRNKMFLTDNIYATDRSMEWKTTDVIIPELFVPDIPIGRLVESPEDISAVIAAFYQKGYVNPDKIFVTGYDFLSDSASDCSSTLENRTKGNTTNLISQKEVTDDYFKNIKKEMLNVSNDIVFVFQHAEHDLFYIPKYRVGSENITSQNISTSAGDLNLWRHYGVGKVEFGKPSFN